MNRTGDQVRHDQALRSQIRKLLHSIPCSDENTVIDLRTRQAGAPSAIEQYERGEYAKARTAEITLRKEQEAAEKAKKERRAAEAAARKLREQQLAEAKKKASLERRAREKLAIAEARATRAKFRQEEAQKAAEVRRSARLEALLEKEREREREKERKRVERLERRTQKKAEKLAAKAAGKPVRRRNSTEPKAVRTPKALPVPGNPKLRKCPHCDYTATYAGVYAHVPKHSTPPEGTICGFGCGQPARFFTLGGKAACDESGRHCPAIRKLYSLGNEMRGKNRPASHTEAPMSN